MTKSVAIIGKGPSALKSTKEHVDSFDEVAICNFPPMEGYEQYIGTRAQYHFINAGDPYPYQQETINNLGLKAIFNTQAWGTDIKKVPPPKILPNHEVAYYWDYGFKVREKYENSYGFWPSTGIMALDYFLNNEDYHKIDLIGFDFFRAGDSVYYFTKHETNPSLHYLWNNKTYSTDGRVMGGNAHGGEKARNAVTDLIAQSDQDISFKLE